MSSCLALTCGEPAGIGPDLILQLAQQPKTQPWLAIGCRRTLLDRAQQLGLSLQIHSYQADEPVQMLAGQLTLVDVPTQVEVQPGQLNPANAQHVLDMLQIAAQGCLQGRWHGIVTAPVHKGIINDAGQAFSGHTEFFRDVSGVDEVVMMLATNDLRVALVTTHLPLRQVADAITAERLERVIRILHQDLQRYFKLPAPRILVAGLNPHAGEDGHLGHEELQIIGPTLQRLREQGMQLIGPLPADTLYTPKQLQTADATLAMYHDQGLPVLKFHGFGRAANITLGLPFVRTSVDHGTALDLAATGQADAGSLATAIDVAAQMAQ